MIRFLPILATALAMAAAAPIASAQAPEKKKTSAPKVVRPLAIAVKRAVTVSGKEQAGAILLVQGGVVSKAGRIPVPKNAVKVSLVNAWVMPGLVDAVTRAGGSSDLWESAAAFTPELRAADALDPWSREVAGLGRAGITTFGLVPQPRNVAGGFAAACRALAGTSDASPTAEVLVSESLPVFSLTGDAMRTSRFPGSRMGAIPALRQAFAAGEDPAAPMLEIRETGRDAAQVRAALARVVAGKRALFHAGTSDEIDAALSLREWFPDGFTICFPTEAHRRVRELGRARARVVLTPPAPGASQRELELPAKLHAAGASVVFASNTPTGRPDRLLLGASLAHAAGLPRDAALRAVTTEAAALLGAGAGVGAIAEGGRADLIFLSGDPLSGSAQLLGVMAGGRWLLKPPGVK